MSTYTQSQFYTIWANSIFVSGNQHQNNKKATAWETGEKARATKRKKKKQLKGGAAANMTIVEHQAPEIIKPIISEGVMLRNLHTLPFSFPTPWSRRAPTQIRDGAPIRSEHSPDLQPPQTCECLRGISNRISVAPRAAETAARVQPWLAVANVMASSSWCCAPTAPAADR